MTTPDPTGGGDRFRPPRARVEDEARPAVPSGRPVTVWIAVLVLLAAVIEELMPLANGGGLEKFSLAQQLTILASFALVILVAFALIVLIFRGVGWARLAWLAFYALTLNAALSGKPGKMEVLKVAAETIALILLFVPPASAWFRRRDS